MPLIAVLVIPASRPLLLALLPGYRLTARLNVLAALADAARGAVAARRAAGARRLPVRRRSQHRLHRATTFVGFTTSVFSASYIGHELEIGRLTPRIPALLSRDVPDADVRHEPRRSLANNIGLMWVAIELATLTTVLMVGIYRTHEALEAAWKYFILGSVGIALALFGTILVYMAARPVIGEGLDAMVWTVLIEQAGGFDPALLNVAFVFLLLGYGTKVGLAPLHAWLPDAHAEGPTPISAVLSGLLLNVALYAAAALQDAARRQPGRARARAADGDDGAGLADLRRLHALPPARHQAHVRLLVDRAHGASSPSPSAWAARSPTSPACCT